MVALRGCMTNASFTFSTSSFTVTTPLLNNRSNCRLGYPRTATGTLPAKLKPMSPIFNQRIHDILDQKILADLHFDYIINRAAGEV